MALAASRARDLGLPYSPWSLSRLREEARNRRIVDLISIEWLRIVLDEADISYQAIRTWKESKDPQFEQKRKRIDRLIHQKHNPPVVLSLDAIGPISLQPQGAQGWFRSEHPERIPSTYQRLKGTRYLYLAFNVSHQRLSGRLYLLKGGEPGLDYVQRGVGKYPRNQRVSLIQDNLSVHWTPGVLGWARETLVTLVASATRVSWMNPVMSYAGDLQKLVLTGLSYHSWTEVKGEVARATAKRLLQSGARATREEVPGHPDARVANPPTTYLEAALAPADGAYGRTTL